jgi:hypothetical protein
MRRLIRWFIRLLQFVDRVGMKKGFYAYFFPVYWIQDSNMVNGGSDIISITDPKGAWFKGTYHQWDSELKAMSERH